LDSACLCWPMPATCKLHLPLRRALLRLRATALHATTSALAVAAMCFCLQVAMVSMAMASTPVTSLRRPGTRNTRMSMLARSRASMAPQLLHAPIGL
jgi:hypothetical protein